MKQTAFLILVLFLTACQNKQAIQTNIESSDIDNFWMAYDKIVATTDTTAQAQILKSQFFDRGTPGLKGIMQARNYTEKEYLEAINKHPLFWQSIRENTFKSKTIGRELELGIAKLKKIYPELRPAKIYFTMGAFRTSGTALDSMVLIGSELAMTDENTVSTEFPAASQPGRRKYFDQNPIENVVLLNVHEYVHTQQNPIVHNLLSQCLYEGIAEFVSVKAMEVPSSTPAIQFGKKNEKAVREKFEHNLFLGNKTYEWIWGDAENGFGIRDLGYYIGYEICERYYQKAKDKPAAIKKMIELDYHNEQEIEEFVDGTNFLSASLEKLYTDYENQRPKVLSITQFDNGSQQVSPKLTTITLNFSSPMDANSRGFELGPLGVDHVLRVQEVIGFSEDGKSFSFAVALTPDKRFQSEVSNRFLDRNGLPLKPFLIDFKTSLK